MKWQLTKCQWQNGTLTKCQWHIHKMAFLQKVPKCLIDELKKWHIVEIAFQQNGNMTLCQGGKMPS